MHFKTLLLSHCIPLRHPTYSLKFLSPPSSTFFSHKTPNNPNLQNIQTHHENRLITSCISPTNEGLSQKLVLVVKNDEHEDTSASAVVEEEEEEEEGKGEVGGEVKRGAELENQSIWNQLKEIVMFTGPAMGLWLCGPLMSLIDTAVIGQGSSIELAALGPATVVCDNISYVFMFLSIATSNMVANSLAKQDKLEVQHRISILLFVGLACGIFMLFCTKFLGTWALTAFTGAKNVHIVPAADKYVQIRGLAWPAILIGWVAQSASLGMKDSWGPLKALAVASAVNGIGDVVLCSFLGYGIAGAAWATMVSQVIAGYMMVKALNEKGYNAYALSIPSFGEILEITALAAPVFITMMSKVAFYSLLAYFATAMGTHTAAGHQVMLQQYMMCTVLGEPLSQAAQSFMPELMYGFNRSLAKARMLLRSLLIIGAAVGLTSGAIATFVPWFFPNIYTSDPAVVIQMHKVLVPYFIALFVTACTLSLEGTLLAGRELKYLSLSMSGCFSLGAIVLMLVCSRGYGLQGCWYSLVGFQWARFFLALYRLLSPNGILYSDDGNQYELAKLKSV